MEDGDMEDAFKFKKEGLDDFYSVSFAVLSKIAHTNLWEPTTARDVLSCLGMVMSIRIQSRAERWPGPPALDD